MLTKPHSWPWPRKRVRLGQGQREVQAGAENLGGGVTRNDALGGMGVHPRACWLLWVLRLCLAQVLSLVRVLEVNPKQRQVSLGRSGAPLHGGWGQVLKDKLELRQREPPTQGARGEMGQGAGRSLQQVAAGGQQPVRHRPLRLVSKADRKPFIWKRWSSRSTCWTGRDVPAF